MNSSQKENDGATEESVALKVLDSYRYWLKGRVIFNFLLGLAGGIPVCIYWHSLRFADLTGVFIWALVANGLYSLGHELEAFILVRSKGRGSMAKFRTLLFLAGTGLYTLLTFLWAWGYFISHK